MEEALSFELTAYDQHRTAHKVRDDPTPLQLPWNALAEYVCCPICLSLFNGTRAAKDVSSTV